MEAYPFQSKFTGYDEAGNPQYDRAVGADFLRSREKLYYKNGVFANPADNFQVVAGSGMQVSVKPGSCFIEGVTGIEKNSTALTIEPAEELINRIDIVVLRCDFVNRWIELVVKKGTTELTRTSDIYELELAEITVAKMATAIDQSAISDKRADGTLCGKVGINRTIGSEDGGGVTEIIPITMGGTGADNIERARQNLGITPANIGAQPAGNYQPAGSYAAANHTHSYAGSSSAGGAANSAVKLQTARAIKIGSQSINFDGSSNITFNAASMGLSADDHNHSYLYGTKYLNAAYGDDGREVLIVNDFLFADNADNPYMAMNSSRSMHFLGYGITGNDFEFVGDVQIDGDIYGGPSIKSSDRREKHDILDIGNRYEAMFQKLRPVTFVYNDGSSGRVHLGFISQEVEQALLDAGLSTEEFAGFVKMPEFGTKEMHETEIRINEEGEAIEVPVTRTEVDTGIILDYRYKLRYDEFTALNTHMIQQLMARVGVLEAKIAELEGKLNGNRSFNSGGQ